MLTIDTNLLVHARWSMHTAGNRASPYAVRSLDMMLPNVFPRIAPWLPEQIRR